MAPGRSPGVRGEWGCSGVRALLVAPHRIPLCHSKSTLSTATPFVKLWFQLYVIWYLGRRLIMYTVSSVNQSEELPRRAYFMENVNFTSLLFLNTWCIYTITHKSHWTLYFPLYWTSEYRIKTKDAHVTQSVILIPFNLCKLVQME